MAISISLAVVFIIAAILRVQDNGHRRTKRPYFKPACDGLACQSTAQCGSRCTCVFNGLGPLGVCIAKPPK
jgi:hypothetical protein